MKKYGLLLIKGDDVTVLETHEDKDIALTRGLALSKNYPKDEYLVSCVLSDFDENNNISKPYKWMCVKSWIY